MKNIILLILLISCASNFSSENPSHKRSYEPKISILGQGAKVPFSPGHEMIMHISREDLPSHLTLTEVQLAPKSMGAPPHIHKKEEEIFIVVEGTVHFLNDDKEVVAKKGSVASLPRGHFHGFWNPTAKPARLALLIAPGHFEKFFYAVEEALKERAPKSPQEFGAIITELAGDNEVTIDMSKLPDSGKRLLPN